MEKRKKKEGWGGKGGKEEKWVMGKFLIFSGYLMILSYSWAWGQGTHYVNPSTSNVWNTLFKKLFKHIQ